MYSVEDKIGFIRTTADAVLADLKAAPDRTDIIELLEACEQCDEKYRNLCFEFDERDGVAPGTNYNEGGLSIEFYIEALDWEDISKALRKLRKSA